MGIKGIIAKAGGKAADGVSKLSSLSPEQLNRFRASGTSISLRCLIPMTARQKN